MKTSLTVSASILTLFLVGGVVAQSNKGENSEISYADCLSQEDVTCILTAASQVLRVLVQTVFFNITSIS